MRQKSDTQTLDLLSWQPPALVRRYDERRVRAANLRDKIALAVAETLKECGMPRDEVARRMEEWLGERVSASTLDAYASQARDDHSISLLRVLALLHVTGDVRLLQLGAEMFGHAVIPARYLAAAREAMTRAQIDNLKKVAKAERRSWRGKP